MRIYPSTVKVEGYVYYEDRQNPELIIKERIPVEGYLFKENGSENHTLRFSFHSKHDQQSKEVLYDLKTKTLHLPDEPTFIPDYCDIVKISLHKYLLILSILQAGLNGQIYKSYKIVGNICELPDEIEYLTAI